MSAPEGPESSARSDGRRWLVGCGLGCLGLAALVIGSCVAGVAWLVLPPAQIATDSLVGPETLAVLRVEDLARDRGAQQALAALEAAARRAADEPGRRGGAPPFSKLLHFLPREATVVLERSVEPSTPAGACLALNLRNFVRPVRLALHTLGKRQDGWSRLERGGVQVRAHETDGVALAFVAGTLLVADRLGTLERVLGRVAARDAAGNAASPLPPEFPPAQEGWDVRAWAEGEGRELEEALGPWLERLPGRSGGGARAAPLSELLRGAQSLQAGADLVDGERWRWRARLELVDALAAERVLVRAEEALRRAEARAREQGRELRWRAFAGGRSVTVEGEEGGLGSFWPELVPR